MPRSHHLVKCRSNTLPAVHASRIRSSPAYEIAISRRHYPGLPPPVRSYIQQYLAMIATPALITSITTDRVRLVLILLFNRATGSDRGHTQLVTDFHPLPTASYYCCTWHLLPSTPEYQGLLIGVARNSRGTAAVLQPQRKHDPCWCDVEYL